jgi:hypothetical protein
MRFDPSLPLDAALDQYFRENGFSPDAPERFIRVNLGRLRVPFPNTESRRRVLRRHDLHHIATELDTDLAGESEIAAFELAAGCGRSLAAWFYDLGAFALGLARWPRRVLRAFARGRRSRSLLVHPALGDARTVGELRAHLELPGEARFGWHDLPAFLGLLAVVALYLPSWPLLLCLFTAQALLREELPAEGV